MVIIIIKFIYIIDIYYLTIRPSAITNKLYRRPK